MRRLVEVEEARLKPADADSIDMALTLLSMACRYPLPENTSADPKQQMMLDMAKQMEIEDLQSLPSDLFFLAWQRLRRGWREGFAPRVGDFRDQVKTELFERQTRVERYRTVLRRLEGQRVRGGGFRRLA